MAFTPNSNSTSRAAGPQKRRTKKWDEYDTTNSVHRDQYIAAHLDALTTSGRGKGGSRADLGFEGMLADDRPMRVSLPFPVGNGGGGASSSHRTGSGGGAGEDSWRSWDISTNPTLAKATLKATHSHVREDEAVLEASSASFTAEGGGVLPAHLHRSNLKMQLPIQHRLVNEFHHRVRSGEWRSMLTDGRKLSLRLMNSYVRPVCASVDQQSKLLAYYLYDLREDATVAQRLFMYNTLAEVFEGISPDHLAILLAGVSALNEQQRAQVLGAVRDEMAFAQTLPYSLGVAFVKSSPLGEKCELLPAVIKVLASVPNPSLITDGTWALLARHVRAGGGSLEAVQSVVDAATTADARHYRNIELWNAYLAVAPIEHATEMLIANMPKYNAIPNMVTYAEVSRKCQDGDHWRVALEVVQRAVSSAPIAEDPRRLHDAYREVLMSSLRTFKASQRKDAIALVKRLVPNLRSILRL